MNNRKITALIFNLVLAFGITIATLPAQAAVPQTLNYQGQLASAAGVPENGTVNMTFSLYDVATGGAVLWMEMKSVAVSNGMYSVILGGDTPLDAGMFGAPRYLGIRVGTDPEMTPRIALSSSATALIAADTMMFGGRVSNEYALATDLSAYALATDVASTYVTAAALASQLAPLNTQVATLNTQVATLNTQVATLGTQMTSSNTQVAALGAQVTQLQSQLAVSVQGVQAPQASTLTTVDTAVNVGQYTSITIGADGMPVISYYDNTNGNLKVAKCGNAACSAGNTLTTVDTTWSVGLDTSISIGADGLPVISYRDGNFGDLKVAHCGNASCSAGNTITSVDTVGNVGKGTSITIGADGLPVISYYDATNFDLKVAHCGNALCSAANTITSVDTAGDVGYHTSLSIGADGLPVISYYDNINGDLKMAHCGNVSCSAGNTITAVDTVVVIVGEYTSITIGADGLPMISYFDSTNQNLKVAKCGNAACSAGNTITVVDTVMGTGYFTSITIGADGMPMISYQDTSGGTNFGLKVAHCGNAACSAGNTLTAVDTVGYAGYYTSISIGADGLPIISYHNGYLRVAKCANAFCAPYFRRR